MTSNEDASSRRLRLVETHGYNGLALLTLYDGWRYFEPSDIDGFIAFELHRGTAVACGDPVCSPEDAPAILGGFAAYCASRNWRFTFVGASARLGRIASDAGFKAIKIGEEPFFDLVRHSLSGRGAKKARSAINLARRTGIVVEEYSRPSPAIDSEIEAVSKEWLDTRDGPPMSYLLRSRPLARREKKRIFTATYNGVIVAALTAAPAPARNMLYVEEQVRRKDAPYGTSELLIETARVAAKADGYALLSLGTAPLHGATKQPYGRFRLIKLLFKALCMKVNFIYSFRSLNHFKKKFAPTFWEDNFFIYSGSLLMPAIAVITAFAPDGIPSLVLPKRLQWMRFVPQAVLWSAAATGIVATAFAAYEFPMLTLPVRVALDALRLGRMPADLMIDRAFGHRLISSLVLVVGIGAAVWRRRARA